MCIIYIYIYIYVGICFNAFMYMAKPKCTCLHFIGVAIKDAYKMHQTLNILLL